MTLWLVPQDVSGLHQAGGFDGLGLRGNGSTPVTAEDVAVLATTASATTATGLDVALAAALPWFLVLTGAFSLGTMEAVTAETGRPSQLHPAGASRPDPGRPASRPHGLRHACASAPTAVRALLGDTLARPWVGREDATLRVLEIKAAAGEAAIDVTDLAMKVCGGAAFRKELGIERRFRDARAARVMAPTTDALLRLRGPGHQRPCPCCG